MAQFDVPVPQIDPGSYLHYSHPISGVETDMSKAKAIEGIGNAVKDTVEGVDKTLKTHAEYLGEQMGEQEQTDFLNAVKTTDSLTKQQDNVPQPVQDGISYIQRNQDAYGQGKVRETEYYKNLYEKAKQLRSQWPSYRDYIDKGVEKATGITPNANQYIKSLLAEINENKTKEDKYDYEIFTKASGLNAEGFDGMDRVAAGLANHSMPREEALRRINMATKIKSAALVQQFQIGQNNLAEGNMKLDQKSAEAHIGEVTSQLYNNMYNNLLVDIGAGPEKIQGILDRVAAGTLELSDENSQKINLLVNNEYTKVRAYADKLFSGPTMTQPQSGIGPPAPGKSIRVLAGDKYESALDQGFAQHKSNLESFSNKDWGFNLRQHRTVDAIINKSAWESLSNEGTGPWFKMSGAAHRIGGDNMIPALEKTMLSGTGPNSIPLPDRTSIAALVTSLSNGPKFKGIGGVNSWNDLVDAAATSSKNPATGEGPNPATMRVVAGMPATILLDDKTPDPVKMNWIYQAFTPKNDGVLSKIEMDYQDDKGNKIQGRYGAFAYLTSKKVVDEVNRLASVGGSQIRDIYNGWVDKSFDHDLFSEDIKKLEAIQHQPNFGVSFVAPDNGSAPFFKVEQNIRGGLRPTGTQGEVISKDLKQSIDNVNTGIASLHTVHQNEGPAFVKTYLMRILVANGINPNEGNSIARSLLNSLRATKKPETTGKDQGRAGRDE